MILSVSASVIEIAMHLSMLSLAFRPAKHGEVQNCHKMKQVHASIHPQNTVYIYRILRAYLPTHQRRRRVSSRLPRAAATTVSPPGCDPLAWCSELPDSEHRGCVLADFDVVALKTILYI